MTNIGNAGSVIGTGVSGLDEILGGGLTPHRLYLIEGDPGTGKTTLALQFLLEGVRQNERCLYVTLSETREELRGVADSHGWSIDGFEIFELVPPAESLDPDAQNTMFHPGEVELNHTSKAILARVEAIKPSRVVFDSLSEMRLLAQDPLRYRRQILALKQFFIGRQCTVVLLDDRSADAPEEHVQSLAHGIVSLEQMSPRYGAERRTLRVLKMRGKRYRGGYHDFIIRTGGLAVFPRLIAAEHQGGVPRNPIRSGVEALDHLLGGGLDPGTSTLVMGPAGSGKSTLLIQYAVAAAEGGARAACFIFDETVATLMARCDGLGLPLREHVEADRIRIRQIDPAEVGPGEFVHTVRAAVEEDGVRILTIDSLNGYLNAMPDEPYLTIQFHELLTYLSHQGVATMLTLAQHGLVGHMQSPVDLSYLADTVVLLRYFEAEGAVHQALSVIKKRSGRHERTIRELRLGPGVIVGPPLRQFHGVLTGVPVYRGDGRVLTRDPDATR